LSPCLSTVTVNGTFWSSYLTGLNELFGRFGVVCPAQGAGG
jgi:hypothetical protein